MTGDSLTMVARKADAESHARHPLARAFEWWRRTLYALSEPARTAARAAWRDLMALKAGDMSALTNVSAVWLGGGCLVIGTALRFALGSPATQSLYAGSVMGLLAVARLAIMGLSPSGLDAEPKRLRGAWSVGLIPFALAVDPGSSVVAWIASAGVTAWALNRLGQTGARTLRAVGLAWGVSAALSIAEWVGRGLLATLTPIS